jgi:hypothetical protein
VILAYFRVCTIIHLDALRENMKLQDSNPKFEIGASRIYRTSINNFTITVRFYP